MKRTLAKLISVLTMLALLTGCGAKPETLQPSRLGVLDGMHYENRYVGYSCDFPEDWVVAGAPDLQDMTLEIQDALENTDIAAEVSAYPQVADLNAMDPNHGTSVNVIYTELDAQERKAYADMTEEQVVDTAFAMRDEMISSYESMGMEIFSMEKVTVTFMGRERTAIQTVGRVSGIDIYMTQICDFQLGGRYGVTTTFTGLDELFVEECMAMFSPIPTE